MFKLCKNLKSNNNISATALATASFSFSQVSLGVKKQQLYFVRLLFFQSWLKPYCLKLNFEIKTERSDYKTMPNKNSGKEWSPADISKVRTLAGKNKPTGLIAWELGRSKSAIQNKASEEGISLRPTNKSPYNRRKS